MFFAHFHILDRSPPDFAPDFTNKHYGEYGHREWYSSYVFYAGATTREMSYDSEPGAPSLAVGKADEPVRADHHERITIMHKKNNIDITKKTHAGRHYAALTARAHGASMSGTKALGGWNESGSFNSVYDRAFPLDALLGAGMYNGRRPEEYALPRGSLCKLLLIIDQMTPDMHVMPPGPPQDLLTQIFPFVESAQAELQDRVRKSSLSTDIALKQFLSVLTWFRTVLLQDGAVLYSRYPQLPVFQFHPFSSPQFHAFASWSVQQVASAEEASRLAFQNLPQHLITSLQGIVTNLSLEQQAQRAENEALRLEVQKHIAMQNVLLTELSQRPKKGQRVMGAQASWEAASCPVPQAAASLPQDSPQAPLQCFVPDSGLSSDPAPSDPRSEIWSALLRRYGRGRLDAHKWEWRDGDWLPHYRYQPIHTITELWTEHTEGLGGHLSTRELVERWGAKWRRNEGSLKTEGGRRAKVTTLIQELAAKPNWNVPLALRFVREKYENNPAYLGRVRAFCDYLQKDHGAGHRAVLEAAMNYP